MYKVLIVEDDKGLADGMAIHAQRWGLETETVTDFQNVMDAFRRFEPHIVLLDITLPYYSGYYWCEQIRAESKVPILFVSSASDRMNQLMALNMGGDDFIAKPFDATLLIAKIQALLRRAYDFEMPHPKLTCHGATLDDAQQVLIYKNEKIELTKNEYRILSTLMEKQGEIVTRETLMQRLWESENFVDENTLSVNVNRLRKKLEACGLDEMIFTKFGVGYWIE